jgi:hypothetical protein
MYSMASAIVLVCPEEAPSLWLEDPKKFQLISFILNHQTILWSAMQQEATLLEVVSASSSLVSQLPDFQKSKADLNYLRYSRAGG